MKKLSTAALKNIEDAFNAIPDEVFVESAEGGDERCPELEEFYLVVEREAGLADANWHDLASIPPGQELSDPTVPATLDLAQLSTHMLAQIRLERVAPGTLLRMATNGYLKAWVKALRAAHP